MGDHHHQITNIHPTGIVDHMSSLSRDLSVLYLDDTYSDITLLVQNERFPAHKVILAARSDYFRALLYGGLKESNPGCCEVELKDSIASAFKILLRYIYTGQMNLRDLSEEELLELLGLSHKYGFIKLEDSISLFLQEILNSVNVCSIFDISSMYGLRGLSSKCLQYMDGRPEEIMESESFLNLSNVALEEVIERDSFNVAEILIFKAVCKWHEHNAEPDISHVMQAIRLPLMTLDEILSHVRPSNLLSAEVLLDNIQLRVNSSLACRDLRYRGSILFDENVATSRHGAEVIEGEVKEVLLDGDCDNYDLDRGFCRHSIEDDAKGIIVKLGHSYIINTIKLLLWDKDSRSYSYRVETSMDQGDWALVVDYSKHLCRAWQEIRFKKRVAQYVRVVGTHNTQNKVFHLIHFECSYSEDLFQLSGQYLVPSENFATVEKCALVPEGVSRSRNALIDGNTMQYDWDQGYTCHQLGSGSILVQLAQPIVVSTMKLLLWDCDSRSYSYIIEVSTDRENWVTVADKSKEACRSWQLLTFDPLVVVFIKIIGTHNTANEVFHCVHFECPANMCESEDVQTHGPVYGPPVEPRLRDRGQGPQGHDLLRSSDG